MVTTQASGDIDFMVSPQRVLTAIREVDQAVDMNAAAPRRRQPAILVRCAAKRVGDT